MKKIDITGIDPEKKLFHNEEIDTYATTVAFDEIEYWPSNLRTLLAFEMLEAKFKKKLKNISLEEVTRYLASQSEIKLSDLAASIKKNDVRVPLIILDDGTLLDGNRRYFACSLLQLEDEDVELQVPVLVIKKGDISSEQKYKILAEANFVSDYKVPWPLDVKARVTSEFYDECIKGGMSEDDAYLKIKDVYGLSKSDVKAYVETIELTKEYINRAKKNKKRRFQLRHQVLMKFVYFWEFRNKAFRGRGVLDAAELKKVKPLFFKMIETKCFNNIKQVEPMIRSCRDSFLWEILSESKGRKIDQVEILFREKKVIRSAEDKVRNFLKWLNSADRDSFSENTFHLLDDLADAISELRDEG